MFQKNILSQTGILSFVSFVFFSLTAFPALANRSTRFTGTQEANIQGDNNEVNQTINQYYFENPGRGAVKRREPESGANHYQQPSINRNSNRTNKKQWGQVQGQEHRRQKY